MNHNLETAPRLYKEARPGSDYQFSLDLLKRFKDEVPGVPTKSGIMVGLGETDDEIRQVMRDMRAHNIDMITIGQYLAPSGHHLPVRRYVTPAHVQAVRAAKPTSWASRTRPLVRDGALQLPRGRAGPRGSEPQRRLIRTAWAGAAVPSVAAPAFRSAAGT